MCNAFISYTCICLHIRFINYIASYLRCTCTCTRVYNTHFKYRSEHVVKTMCRYVLSFFSKISNYSHQANWESCGLAVLKGSKTPSLLSDFIPEWHKHY